MAKHTPNPRRVGDLWVYDLEVDDRPEHALGLAGALRRLLGGDKLVGCPECGTASPGHRDELGAALPSPWLRCGACGHRWPAPDDRPRVAAEWRRRARLASIAARAALPRALARREVELVRAEDLGGWARLGIADALLGRSPAHLPDPAKPWAHAYACGWASTMTRLIAKDAMPDNDETEPQGPADYIDLGPMIFSKPCDKIAAALAAAQGELEQLKVSREVKVPGKDGKAGYSYKYAELSEVLAVCRRPFAAHGLAVLQPPVTSQRGVEVSTLIMHSSGQWAMARPLFMPTAGNAQAIGSAITYARRYQLLPMVGLAPEDDDGTAATEASTGWNDPKPSKPGRKPAPRKPAKRETAPPFLTDPEQIEKLRTANRDAAHRVGQKPARVFAEAVQALGYPTTIPGRDDQTYPVDRPSRLRVDQARHVLDYLDELGRDEPDELAPGEPPTYPDDEPEDLVRDLANPEGEGDHE